MAYYYQPSGAPSFTPLPQGMNKYWIPHKDIHKRVIMTNIQYYLGREATVRSYTKDVRLFCLVSVLCRRPMMLTIQGEDGFLITTPGACLTDVSDTREHNWRRRNKNQTERQKKTNR